MKWLAGFCAPESCNNKPLATEGKNETWTIAVDHAPVNVAVKEELRVDVRAGAGAQPRVDQVQRLQALGPPLARPRALRLCNKIYGVMR
jgi:hypothetical protein